MLGLLVSEVWQVRIYGYMDIRIVGSMWPRDQREWGSRTGGTQPFTNPTHPKKKTKKKKIKKKKNIYVYTNTSTTTTAKYSRFHEDYTFFYHIFTSINKENMKTDVNLEMYRNVDAITMELQRQITEIEQSIDEFCSEFVKSQEDLQLVSLFQSMLTDLYSDLEQLEKIRSVLYN